MLETPKRWAIHLIGLIAALSMVPAACSQHEAGEVYLGLAAGFHVAPDIEDELRGDVNAESPV